MHIPEHLPEQLTYIGLDTEIEELILQTIVKLPDEAQEFALGDCVFISLGSPTLGRTLSGSVGYSPILGSQAGINYAVESDRVVDFLQSPRNLILLAADDLKRLTIQDALSLIAHEVAHAILGHAGSGVCDDVTKTIEQESQACRLATEWGFNGLGTDESVQCSGFESHISGGPQ